MCFKMDTKSVPTSKNRKNKEKKTENKRARIIIRNLSFKATDEAVTNWFSKYGEIQDVKLLRKQNGDLVGCAFVQYSKVPFAAKAIKECNAKPFLGRPIAIDWAIPKKQYASQDSTPNDNVVSIKEKVDLKNDDKKDGNESEEVEEDESDVDKDEDEDNEDDDEDDDEDEDDEDDEDEEKEDEKGGKKQKNSNRDWSGFDSVTEQKSDVDEGKTVFLRNLDFSTTEDSLKNYMTTFGSMHYALLCMDKVMERPKGTAFVKFKEPESAQKCIEASKNSSLLLDGRAIDAVIAVSRQNLDKQKLEKVKEKKDNRNLYLAREGMIRPGTRAAIGVSTGDVAKRQQNELWKKQMLRNLHMFISRERLCVHNIPPKMTDKQLKKLFLKHAPKEAKITEARVMRDLKKVVDKNMHPSKGYGFVTFSKHEDALQALRNINNNPEIFTPDKRPIVEFSVENRAALMAKMKRTQKSQENSSKPGKSTKQTAAPQPSNEEVPEFSGTIADPKVKGLPSHSGPKIRHRKRGAEGNEGGPGAKKPKITRKMFKNPDKRKMSRKMPKEPMATKKKPSKKQKGTSKFDKMVNEHMKSYASSSSQPMKKKWFDS